MTAPTQAEVFEAVCTLLGWRTEALTKTERLRIGRVARELRAAGATVEILAFGEKVTGPMLALIRQRGHVPKPENVLDAWSEIDRRWQAHVKHLASKNGAPSREVADPLPLAENRRLWREMVERYGHPVKNVEEAIAPGEPTADKANADPQG